MRAVVGRWPGNRIVVGRGGRFGVKPAEMPTAGTAAAPLQACVDPGDDNTEFVWQIGALPSSGLMAANDAGGMSHTGAADGVYTTPFHLWTLADGAAAVVDRGASSFTTSFGVSGITLVGADCAQAALSAAGAITQVHQLAGAGSSQAAASGTGSVGQVQVLAAAGSSQAAASASGAITQRHQLAAAGATQAALSGTGAIGLGSALTLTGASCTAAATSSAATIGQVHAISAVACSQAALSAGAAVSQLHQLAVAGSAQHALSGAGAIVLGSLQIPAAWVILESKLPAPFEIITVLRDRVA